MSWTCRLRQIPATSRLYLGRAPGYRWILSITAVAVLVSSDLSVTSMLLNLLAITFLLESDDMLAHMFLSQRSQQLAAAAFDQCWRNAGLPSGCGGTRLSARATAMGCACFVVFETITIRDDHEMNVVNRYIQKQLSLSEGGCDDLDWFFPIAPAFPIVLTVLLQCLGSCHRGPLYGLANILFNLGVCLFVIGGSLTFSLFVAYNVRTVRARYDRLPGGLTLLHVVIASYIGAVASCLLSLLLEALGPAACARKSDAGAGQEGPEDRSQSPVAGEDAESEPAHRGWALLRETLSSRGGGLFSSGGTSSYWGSGVTPRRRIDGAPPGRSPMPPNEGKMPPHNSDALPEGGSGRQDSASRHEDRVSLNQTMASAVV